MAKEKDLPFRAIMSGISTVQAGRHSTLYLWMRRNHQHITRQMERDGIPWPEFTEAVAKAGLTDRTGKPAQEKTVRQTWFRVRQEIKNRPIRQSRMAGDKAKPGEIARNIAAAPVAPALPTRLAVAASDPTSGDYETPRPKTKLVLEPARPRIHPTKES